MSQTSAIEWTEATWNPVRGCTKVSPGCKHCYAETFAERFRGVKGHPYEQGFDLRLVPDQLEAPLAWKKPKTIFVNSMSDLFHHDIPESYIAQVIEVMRRADWHTYQVLTKRAERMRDLLSGSLRQGGALLNVWWGVSVEDRQRLGRIDHLRKTPAQVRFLSLEPLLEDLGDLDLAGIDWVIVGGESGNGARPMEADWIRSIRQQCQASHVAFFFKQWGGRDKKKAGRLLDGKTYDELPRRVPLSVVQTRNIEASLTDDDLPDF